MRRTATFTRLHNHGGRRSSAPSQSRAPRRRPLSAYVSQPEEQSGGGSPRGGSLSCGEGDTLTSRRKGGVPASSPAALRGQCAPDGASPGCWYEAHLAHCAGKTGPTLKANTEQAPESHSFQRNPTSRVKNQPSMVTIKQRLSPNPWKLPIGGMSLGSIRGGL